MVSVSPDSKNRFKYEFIFRTKRLTPLILRRSQPRGLKGRVLLLAHFLRIVQVPF